MEYLRAKEGFVEGIIGFAQAERRRKTFQIGGTTRQREGSRKPGRGPVRTQACLRESGGECPGA